MGQQGAVPGFRASVNGLQFTNSFPNEPAIVIDVSPLGKVPLGDAGKGLCGGMVYTVIDVFAAGLPPIPDTDHPAQGSPLFKYIVSRLITSWDVPAGVLKYYAWMNTADKDSGFLMFKRRGVAWRTITQEWPRIKTDIDSGALSPLGLVTVSGADPRSMGHNHQVLAYAYDVDDSNVLTLRLYDPNTPPAKADAVQLSVDLSKPTQISPITHNVNIAVPIRGFFRTKYSISIPPTEAQA